MRLLTVSTSCIASAVLLCSATALADPPAAAVPLEHEGVPGVWLPEAISRQVLADVEELRVRRAELELCHKRDEVQVARVKALTKALDAAKKSAAASQTVVDVAVRGREQAERDRDGWFAGKPWVWGPVGVVIGVVATGLVIGYAR